MIRSPLNKAFVTIVFHLLCTGFSTNALSLPSKKIPSSSSFSVEPSTRRKAIKTGMLNTFGLLTTCTTMIESAAAAPPSIDTLNKLYFETEQIKEPPPSSASELNGVDNLYFPDWMEGQWDLTQTLVNTEAPLGLKYMGGPNGDLQIAQKTMQEQILQNGVPYQLQVNFIKTKWGVAEDRLQNLKNRLNTFAKKDVVSTIGYADVGGSNRPSVLKLGGTELDPLQTTLVYFKGPLAQKTFLVGHEESFRNSNSWTGYELTRSIVALTNQNTSPPITADQQNIYYLERVSDTEVRGKLRLCGFLNPQQDKLYFEAKNRAVSIADYTLVFRRKVDDISM